MCNVCCFSAFALSSVQYKTSSTESWSLQFSMSYQAQAAEISRLGQALSDEIERLRAENHDLKTVAAQHVSANADLKAENDSLREEISRLQVTKYFFQPHSRLWGHMFMLCKNRELAGILLA